MLTKILAPLDGTPLAEAGLLWAEKAARRSGASLHLLTVIDPSLADVERRSKEAEAYLQSRRDQLKNKGLTAKIEVASGEPAETILERAESVDLTAVSSGTVRWLISAVLDRVLEKMTRPLVVVRASANGPPAVPDVDRILVSMDRSDYSSDILPVIRGLAKAFGASVTVCHAVSPVAGPFGRAAAAQAPAMGAAASLNEANLFVARVAREFQDNGIDVETVVAIGDPPGQIVNVAQRCGAGLIALTTRGREHLDSRLVGSVANAVLHSTRLPCLLTRRAPVSTIRGIGRSGVSAR
jgi:nucleotide-binding universal stress UspA family protein